MSELSRLRWLCRRGMKELDVVLNAYLDRRYDTASDDERRQFSRLLEMADPELYRLLLGREQAEDAATRRLVEILKEVSAPQ